MSLLPAWPWAACMVVTLPVCASTVTSCLGAVAVDDVDMPCGRLARIVVELGRSRRTGDLVEGCGRGLTRARVGGLGECGVAPVVRVFT